jgi:uncharacterized iron-regulated membrane protein
MYNTIWRWHFYAGLFFIPFILVLGVLLPFLGVSLVAVLLVERWVLRYIPAAKTFLA